LTSLKLTVSYQIIIFLNVYLMRLLCLLSMLLSISLSANAQQAPGLSPLTRIFLQKMERNGGALPANYVYSKAADNKTYVAALIKVNANVDAEAVAGLGVKIGTKAGNIWTAQIPVSQLPAFTTQKGIEYIQLDEPIHATLDSTRKLTRVDSVHAGLGGLPSQFHGQDVVIGIIDAGYDYRHPTLFDTTGARYRVKRVWEQVNTGTPPSGFNYGNEITDTLAMWNTGSDMQISHGAHVSGIAAGSGYGSDGNSQYRGIADAADLVLVGITPPSSDWTSTGMSSIIDGMNYIYTYASSVGKPAVVNLSWGCSIGSHDGLSLFSQACDNLTGPGSIFVCSAGNNGGQKLHIGKTFTAADSVVNTFVTFNPFLSARKTWVDIWGDSSKSYCVQLSLFHGANRIDSTAFICLDNLLHNVTMVGSNSDTFFASVVTDSASFNGKPRIFLDIYTRAKDSVLITVKAIDGKVNMWTGFVENTTGYYADFVSYSFPWATGGDVTMTIGDMASTQSALAVGAYTSKRNYMNVNGGTISYAVAKGQIAPFSSRGPTADGRIKPDITAPGMVLGSAVSSYDSSFMSTGTSYPSVVKNWTNTINNREYSYAMLMGTSMSSPVASGIVALMLEANPNLSPLQVRQAISESAIHDNYTGILPGAGNYIWGAGKINAMGAVAKAIWYLGVDNPQRSGQIFSIYPNPASDQFVISHSGAQSGATTVEVFDMLGRKKYSQTHKVQPGYNELIVNTTDWAKGVYLVKLSSSGRQSAARVVLQ
jgi:hypothetical protein